MRIIVFSDTHGNYSAMHKILKRNGNADIFIFLGDGEQDLEKLKAQYIDSKILYVRGNCDTNTKAPENGMYILPNKMKIFFSHGHKWGVKLNEDKIIEQAKVIGANIVLFGHTHKRFAETKDGILILNPGSAGQPKDGMPASYAWIDIIDDKITYNHVDL